MLPCYPGFSDSQERLPKNVQIPAIIVIFSCTCIYKVYIKHNPKHIYKHCLPGGGDASKELPGRFSSPFFAHLKRPFLFWGGCGWMSLEQLTQTLIGCKPQRLGWMARDWKFDFQRESRYSLNVLLWIGRPGKIEIVISRPFLSKWQSLYLFCFSPVCYFA